MPKRLETLHIAGRDVTITNPDKVYFSRVGHTKLDVVRFYLAVADGALRGVGGRPMALKRYVDGAEGAFFFQKRAPESRPEWIETVELSFPSGRTADEIVVREAAQLAWVVNLGCIDLNPHPVRADDLDHPDELRVDLDPVPGVPWSQIRDVAAVTREALDAVGLVGWPKTSGSRGIHVNVRIERRWTFPKCRAACLGRDVERRRRRSPPRSGGRRSATGVPRLQPEREGSDGRLAYSIRPLPDARVSAPFAWDELAALEPGDFTLATVPGRFAAIGDPGAGIDDAVGSLDALLELSARDEGAGLGDAPWPPNYRKQEGEPPRVQPSRQRRPVADYDTPEAEAEREKARAALERRLAAAVAARRRAGRRPVPGPARPRPDAGRAPSPSSRSPGPRPRPRRSPGSSAGRRAGRRRPPSWSRPTCSSIRCAVDPRPGPGSAST
jgi:DNA ligase D-like protein (predicted polymerase)